MADPTITRAGLIMGPAFHYLGTTAIYTESDFELNEEDAWNIVKCGTFNVSDKTWLSKVMRASFTPFGVYENLSAIFPASFYTSPVRGKRLLGDADVTWKIWSPPAGDLYTMQNGAIIKPPVIQLGAHKDIFGPMEIVGCIKNATAPATANAFYQYQTGQLSPGGTFALTNWLQQTYSATWGAIAGFVAFTTADGWTIECTPNFNPVTSEGLIVDYALESVDWTATCIPIGPSVAQIDAAKKTQGAGALRGARASALGAGTDLVITGTGVSITLNNAGIVKSGHKFGTRELRNGEVQWVATTSVTTGALDPLVVIGTGA